MAHAVHDVVARVRPDTVIVDHLAFGARIGLAAQASVRRRRARPPLGPAGRRRGLRLPPGWPRAITPPDPGSPTLRPTVQRRARRLHRQWNSALASCTRRHADADAFAEPGDLLLLNYPAALHEPAAPRCCRAHAFLGSSVRDEARDEEVEQWLAQADARPSSTSASAASCLPAATCWRGAGGAPRPRTCGSPWPPARPPRPARTVPGDWLVRELPTPGAAAAARRRRSHTAATTASPRRSPPACRLLVLPFSTDQFAGAAAIERHGMGEALDPNDPDPAPIRDAARRLLDSAASAPLPGGHPALHGLSASLRARPGPRRAWDALVGPTERDASLTTQLRNDPAPTSDPPPPGHHRPTRPRRRRRSRARRPSTGRRPRTRRCRGRRRAGRPARGRARSRRTACRPRGHPPRQRVPARRPRRRCRARAGAPRSAPAPPGRAAAGRSRPAAPP